MDTVARIYVDGRGLGFAAGGSDRHRFECLGQTESGVISPRVALFGQDAPAQFGVSRNESPLGILIPTTNKTRERAMKIRTIALATLFALSSTLALAQGSAGSSSQSGSPTASPATSGGTPGAGMSNGTTGMGPSSTTSSPGNASNSGAPTAAGPNSQGTRTEPGAVQGGANGR
jgi:hypothetical protein